MWLMDWGMKKTAWFCVYHSRTIANEMSFMDGANLSRLAVADKLAVVYTPLWMYCKQELHEYMIMEGYNLSFTLCKSSLLYYNLCTSWKTMVDVKCLKFVQEWKDKAYDIGQY